MVHCYGIIRNSTNFLVYIERILGPTGGSICQVIVMTTPHLLGMATHQLLSCVAIVDYSAVSHDSPHGTNLIGAPKFRNQPKKVLDVYTRPFSLFGAGSGDKTTLSVAYNL